MLENFALDFNVSSAKAFRTSISKIEIFCLYLNIVEDILNIKNDIDKPINHSIIGNQERVFCHKNNKPNYFIPNDRIFVKNRNNYFKQRKSRINYGRHYNNFRKSKKRR